ncbi:hypothetical protein COBT_000747 [Conglomerata obtusa]
MNNNNLTEATFENTFYNQINNSKLDQIPYNASYLADEEFIANLNVSDTLFMSSLNGDNFNYEDYNISSLFDGQPNTNNHTSTDTSLYKTKSVSVTRSKRDDSTKHVFLPPHENSENIVQNNHKIKNELNEGIIFKKLEFDVKDVTDPSYFYTNKVLYASRKKIESYTRDRFATPNTSQNVTCHDIGFKTDSKEINIIYYMPYNKLKITRYIVESRKPLFPNIDYQIDALHYFCMLKFQSCCQNGLKFYTDNKLLLMHENRLFIIGSTSYLHNVMHDDLIKFFSYWKKGERTSENFLLKNCFLHYYEILAAHREFPNLFNIAEVNKKYAECRNGKVPEKVTDLLNYKVSDLEKKRICIHRYGSGDEKCRPQF